MGQNEEKRHALPEWARVMFRYVINPVSRPLLKSPLHGLADRFLLILQFTGRTSGKTYEVPLAYDHEGNRGIRLFTDSAWVRNLNLGETVQVLFLGEWQSAHVSEVSADTSNIARCIQRVVAERGSWYQARFRLGSDIDIHDEHAIAAAVQGMKTILLTRHDPSDD